jgi:hypothetical protein
MSEPNVTPAGGLVAAIYSRKSTDQNIADEEKSDG